MWLCVCVTIQAPRSSLPSCIVCWAAASRTLINLISTVVLFTTNIAMPHESFKWCFLEKCVCSSHTLQVFVSAWLCVYRITLALHCGKDRVDRTINLYTLGIVPPFPQGELKECCFWIMMWRWNVSSKVHTRTYYELQQSDRKYHCEIFFFLMMTGVCGAFILFFDFCLGELPVSQE